MEDQNLLQCTVKEGQSAVCCGKTPCVVINQYVNGMVLEQGLQRFTSESRKNSHMTCLTLHSMLPFYAPRASRLLEWTP